MMLAEYEIRFTLPDIGRVPENLKELLNILEKLEMIDQLVKAEESVEYDLSRPFCRLRRKTLFKIPAMCD